MLQYFLDILQKLISSDALKFLIPIVGAGVWAIWKWRTYVGFKRSMLFQELVSRNRFDKEMRSFIYILDDDEKEWYKEDLVGSEMGEVLDKVLFHFCYEIYLRNNRYIGKEEFQPLSYEINRALVNPQMQDYLFNLQMYAKGKGIESPYKYLVKYGVKNKLLNPAFFSDKCDGNVPKFHSYYKKCLEAEHKVAETDDSDPHKFKRIPILKSFKNWMLNH